jgi:hypothetical protein
MGHRSDTLGTRMASAELCTVPDAPYWGSRKGLHNRGITIKKVEAVMGTNANPSFILTPSSRHFSPGDVAIMRHAFVEACRERPLAAASDGQRLKLAKAVVATYKEHLTEGELIEGALQLVDAN